VGRNSAPLRNRTLRRQGGSDSCYVDPQRRAGADAPRNLDRQETIGLETLIGQLAVYGLDRAENAVALSDS
jgi:hypothetical protein